MNILRYLRTRHAIRAAIARADAAETAYYTMLATIYGSEADDAALDARGVSTAPLWTLRNEIRAARRQLASVEA